ncbi:MAG: PQQ-binding-like beta-propeller repeat protein [Akkermansiaceae bacterium]
MKSRAWLIFLVQGLSAEVLTRIDQVGVAGFQHARSVSDIVPLSDGKHLLSSSRDNQVRLWEITTGKEIRSFTNKNFDDIWGLCLLPGEKEFLCAADYGKGGAVVRFEIATGKQLGVYEHSQTAFRIDVHPDGKRFAAGDNANIIKLWDLQKGVAIREFTGHSGSVYSVVFNADGSRLFSGCDEGELKMWDTETGKCLKTHVTKFKKVYTIAPSPDHKRIALVSEDKHVHVFESEKLGQIWKKKMGDEAQVLSWSPDGELIAAAGHDETLSLFNSRNGKVIQRISTNQDHTPVAFTNDGQTLISGGANHLHLHKVDTGERIHPTLGIPALSGGFEGLAITNDGQSIYAHGRGVQLVRWIREGEKTTRISEQPHSISDLALSKDGTLLALSDNAGGVGFFPADSGKLRNRMRTGAPITKLTFGVDSNQLVIGGQQGALSLWNIKEQKRTGTFKGLTKEALDLEVTPDGLSLVTAERNGHVVFWRMKNQQKVSTHRAIFKDGNDREQSEYPRSVALLDNGRSLLAAIQTPQLLSHIMSQRPKPIAMDPGRVKTLVAQLADASFEKRKKATLDLEAMGIPALKILENLTHEDPEVSFRIRGIIRKLSAGSEEGDLKRAHVFGDDVYSLVGDPQGRYFVATVGWSANATLVIGEIIKGTVKVLQTIKSGRSPELVTFSPNGKFLAAGNRNGVVDVYEVGR